MFRIAIGLLLVAIIAAIFGFGGIASTATGFAKIVFVIALILAVVSFIFGGRGGSAIIALLAAGGLISLPSLASASEEVAVEQSSASGVSSDGSAAMAGQPMLESE